MRAFTVFFALFALFAMVAARGKCGANRPKPVHFVDNNPSDPTAVHVVDSNPSDPTAVKVVNNNPSDPTAVNFVGNNPTAVHGVDKHPGQGIVSNLDPLFGQPDSTGIITNPDPTYGQPDSTGVINKPNPDSGKPTFEQPDISPAWAPNNGPPRYPAKQFENPLARDGK